MLRAFFSLSPISTYLVRTNDEPPAVESDGRDAEGGDEDRGALQQRCHRAGGRVVAELEREGGAYKSILATRTNCCYMPICS